MAATVRMVPLGRLGPQEQQQQLASALRLPVLLVPVLQSPTPGLLQQQYLISQFLRERQAAQVRQVRLAQTGAQALRVQRVPQPPLLLEQSQLALLALVPLLPTQEPAQQQSLTSPSHGATQAPPPASPAMPNLQLLRTSLLPNVELLLH
jgi:hypothetical protein